MTADHQLSISLRNEISYGDDWLRLSQEPWPEKDGVGFVDYLRENQQNPNPIDMWAVYDQYLSDCKGDGSFDTTIIVETSRRDLPYKLTASWGELSVKKIVSGTDDRSYSITSFTKSYSIDARYSSTSSIEWEGEVFIAGGESITPPAITNTDGLLTWDIECLGTIRISGTEEHDEYTLTVSPRDGEYEDVRNAFDSTARAFWTDSMATLAIAQPAIVGSCTEGGAVTVDPEDGAGEDECVRRIIEVGLCDGEVKNDYTEPIPCKE